MATMPEGRPRFAAGYIRRSGASAQRDNHSPEVQRAGIKEVAARAGFIVTLWDGDEERGRHTTKRPGYLRTLEAARRGEVQAVLVFHTSRWGRRTGEMVTRLDELDRGGIEFWSVDRGRLQPGLVSTLLFAVDEEFCRILAHNVRPAREDGARGGVHQGPTPFGYTRRYPAWDGRAKRPPGSVLIDPVSGPIVQEMFRRYDAGIDSCRTLARWLNEEIPLPPPHGERWSHGGVYSVLRNVFYTGMVSHNRRPRGYYERADAADYFEAQGRHEALISPELFARVQARRAVMGRQPSHARQVGGQITEGPTRGRQVAHTYLGAGLLRCRGCAGPMRPHALPHTTGHKGSYLCRDARTGRAECREPGYRMDLAHAALVAAVARLRGTPWTPQAADRISGGDRPQHDEARRIARALDEERARLLRHTRALTLLGDPTPAQVTAYRAVSAEIDARIAALEAQKAATASGAHQGRLPDLQALHAELTRTELRDVLATLDWAEDDVDRQIVRSLLQKTVEAATVVDRGPGRSARWLRLEVAWTAGVRALLDAGLLWHEPEPVAI